MTRPFSLYLDLVRFAAAVVVFVSHWAYPRFTDGAYIGVRTLNLGSDAVIVFFVLSGLVIAYSAETKDRSPGVYLFNRATRIYSVAFPAVVLTLVLDQWGAALDPAAYDGWWYAPVGILESLFYGLSFTAEWGSGFRMGTNGPYWSLSYEIAYYLIFGAAIFMSGALRIAVLIGLCVLAGFKVFVLLPAWLAGVVVWRAIAEERRPASPLAAWLTAVAPVGVYVLSLWFGLPGLLMDVTASAFNTEPGAVRAVFRFSDEFLWNNLLGVLVAAHLLGVARLVRQPIAETVSRMGDAIRWLAGASFSIYVVHYPALQFLDTVLPDIALRPIRDALLFAGAMAVCLVFAQAFERPLPKFRALLWAR